MKTESNSSLLHMNEKQTRMASSISETIVLLSFTMLFATLMLGYTMYRLSSDSWPPMGLQRVDLKLPLLSTAIMLLSSFTLSSFNNARLKAGRSSKFFLWLTIILGTCFMVSQFALWEHLDSTGLIAREGIFQSILYGFTWIHAAHVILAWFGLFFLIPTVKDSSVNIIGRVDLISKFWHFLDVIWVIMFLTIFVL